MKKQQEPKNRYHSHKRGPMVKKLEGHQELAPNLVVSVKKLKENGYNVSIIHPNTKQILYEKSHEACSFDEAFLIGKRIKSEKFSGVETWAEELLFIPRPRRGKMKLNLKNKEGNEDK